MDDQQQKYFPYCRIMVCFVMDWDVYSAPSLNWSEVNISPKKQNQPSYRPRVRPGWRTSLYIQEYSHIHDIFKVQGSWCHNAAVVVEPHVISIFTSMGKPQFMLLQISRSLWQENAEGQSFTRTGMLIWLHGQPEHFLSTYGSLLTGRVNNLEL